MDPFKSKVATRNVGGGTRSYRNLGILAACYFLVFTVFSGAQVCTLVSRRGRGAIQEQ